MSNVTTQTATGLARGKFDRVAFNLSIEGRGVSGPQAKNKAQEVVNKHVKSAMEKLQKAGIVFQKDRNESGFAVEQHYIYDNGEHRPSGYKATFTMHMETAQVDRVSDIQDVLTSVEGATVQNPEFILEPANRRQLQKVAVTEAFRVAKERFEEECAILRQNPIDFEINEWNARYNNDTPSLSNAAVNCSLEVAGAANGDDALEIDSGLSNVQVTLTVGYRRVG